MTESTLILDELAAALLIQWRDEAQARGLVLPAPVGVRWTWTRRPVAASVADAVAPVVTGAGPGEVPGAKTTKAADLLTDGVVDRLYDIYAGIGVGRLVVMGGAGTGKTAAAILLALRALTCRAALPPEQRVKAPIPVILTLAGWEPKSEPLVEWAADRLLRDYPLLRGRGHGRALAVSLIRDGRIALLLDGLDEMAIPQQAPALRGMSAASATRIVLLTRPTEYEHAARDNLLPGAVVELLPVDTATASEYLLRGRTTVDRRPWEQLTAQLQASASGPLARAMSTPLMLTLARGSYPAGGHPAELADHDRFPTAEAVEDHLLDCMILNAYGTGEDRQGKYKAAQAVKWLGYIASEMHREGSREFAWWRISHWTPRWLLAIGLGLSSALLALAFAAPAWVLTFEGFVGGISIELLVGSGLQALFIGLALGLIFGFGGVGECAMPSSRRGEDRPAHRRTALWIRDLTNLALLILIPTFPLLIGQVASQPSSQPSSLVCTWRCGGTDLFVDNLLNWAFTNGVPLALIVMALTLAGFTSGMPMRLAPAWPRRADLALGATVGMFVGLLPTLFFIKEAPMLLLSGIGAGLVLGCCMGSVRAGYRKIPTSTPIVLWRSDIGASLTVGALFCSSSLVIVYFFSGRDIGQLRWSAPLLLSLWLIAVFAACRASQLFVASIIGRARGRTPVRLLRFLQDARDRQVLRQAGAVYQFRHARIQDRLAAMYDAEQNSVARRRWNPSTLLPANGHVGSSSSQAPSVRRST